MFTSGLVTIVKENSTPVESTFLISTFGLATGTNLEFSNAFV